MASTRLIAIALAATAVGACAGEPGKSDERSPVATAPAAPYVAALAQPLGAYPEALLEGRFRIVDGCAMIDDDLLVLPPGARGIVRPDGSPAVILPGAPPRELVPGRRIRGGGGAFPLDAFPATGRGWILAEPIPRRCAAIARAAQLMAPVVSVYPDSPHADRLYAAVSREDLSPPPLAPVGGVLRVVDQCLLLGDALLVLPAHSSVEFSDDGKLNLRIAGRGYGRSVAASPGDRISGSGAGLMAEAGPLPALPRPLLEPIPQRCRPAGRRGVMLNPGPDVSRGAGADYADPGAGATMVVPPPAPPPPVSDPGSCPTGTRLSFGLCRRPDGTVVVVHERRPQ